MEGMAVAAAMVGSGRAAVPNVHSRALSDLASLDAALASGLQREWRGLMAADPLASVFQSPGWCVPWYRCYQDAYEPHVVVVSIGIASWESCRWRSIRTTRELVFASNTMADYRDIVAAPGFRASVVAELIRSYISGGFAGPLRIGWLDPESDTLQLVVDACRAMGLRHGVGHQPCWRWFPAEGENLQKKFSRVKTHLNYFKRQGDVTFEVVTSAADWRAFSREFFQQHSLRQLQAARNVLFDDARKRQLYDALFEAGEVRMHVAACRVNGRLIAGHIGWLWRDVLLFGAPSIDVEHEHRSPAVILMTWIIQHAASLGLAGLDLTIGEGEFKRRLGNQRVELSVVEVYARARDYHVDAARRTAVRWAKDTVERVMGTGAWNARVKPAAERMTHRRRRLAEMGVRAAIVRAAGFAAGGDAPEVVYSAAASAIRFDPPIRRSNVTRIVSRTCYRRRRQGPGVRLRSRPVPGATRATEPPATALFRCRRTPPRRLVLRAPRC